MLEPNECYRIEALKALENECFDNIEGEIKLYD